MQKPAQITFNGLERSERMEHSVRAKVAMLEHFAPAMIACHVTVEARQQRQGPSYDVQVQVRLPGTGLVASRGHTQHCAHEDVYVAIRDAFGAALSKTRSRGVEATSSLRPCPSTVASSRHPRSHLQVGMTAKARMLRRRPP